MAPSSAEPLDRFIPASSGGRRYNCVLIGASAGGLRAIEDILAALPPSFPLPILVVLHLSATEPSRLAEVLGYRTRLKVKWAQQGERALPGTVHVAPPDRHLLLRRDGRLALSDSERVGWWRPAVDRLFESAAAAFGAHTIAIVLSGALWDGTRGMAAIRNAGGLSIAQDEWSSDHFAMPASAIDGAGADIVLPPRKIAEVLMIATAAGLSEAA